MRCKTQEDFKEAVRNALEEQKNIGKYTGIEQALSVALDTEVITSLIANKIEYYAKDMIKNIIKEKSEELENEFQDKRYLDTLKLCSHLKNLDIDNETIGYIVWSLNNKNEISNYLGEWED